MLAAANQPFAVNLEFFTGPLDLLLHLVHQQEVSLADVDMTALCEQYLEVISSAQIIDLERASEYLVIAATLLAIKSQALLPNVVAEGESLSPDEWYDPNFFEHLRARLQAYDRTKNQAIALTQLPQLGVDTFVRGNRAEIQSEEEPDQLGDSYALGSYFFRLLKRVGQGLSAFRLRMEPISVVSYMMKVIDRLQLPSNLRKGGLFSIVAELQSEKLGGAVVNSRGDLTGAFIAVLELSKRGILTASQREENGDIDLELRLKEGASETAATSLQSEFDQDSAIQTEHAAAREDSKVLHLDNYRS